MPAKNPITTTKAKLEIIQIKKPKLEPLINAPPTQELKKIELPPDNPDEPQKKKKEAVAEKPKKREKKKKVPKIANASLAEVRLTNPININTEPEQKADKVPKPESPIFQAIGVIAGEIAFSGNHGTIIIDGEKYCLLPSSLGRKHYKLIELAQYIAETGEAVQRISVYPKVTRSPSKKQPTIAFCVVGIDKKNNPVLGKFGDNEFKLSGLWQYQQSYATPCITVKRNFDENLLQFTARLPEYERQKISKGIHVPLVWEKGLESFRFNSKLSKEENGKPLFVSVKARFLPEMNVFEFIEQLAEPLEKAPKYYKV